MADATVGLGDAQAALAAETMREAALKRRANALAEKRLSKMESENQGITVGDAVKSLTAQDYSTIEGEMAAIKRMARMAQEKVEEERASSKRAASYKKFVSGIPGAESGVLADITGGIADAEAEERKRMAGIERFVGGISNGRGDVRSELVAGWNEAKKAEAEDAKKFKEGLTVATVAATGLASAFTVAAHAASYMANLQRAGGMNDAERRAAAGMAISRMGGDKAKQDYWANRIAMGETGAMKPSAVLATLQAAAETGKYGLVPGSLDDLESVISRGMKGDVSEQEMIKAASSGPFPGISMSINRLGAKTPSTKTRLAANFAASIESQRAASEAFAAEEGRALEERRLMRENQAREGSWLQSVINTMPSADFWDKANVRAREAMDADIQFEKTRWNRQPQRVEVINTPPPSANKASPSGP